MGWIDAKWQKGKQIRHGKYLFDWAANCFWIRFDNGKRSHKVYSELPQTNGWKLINKLQYWYKYYIGECPVCGCNQSYKYRVYDEPKPKEREKRYKFLSDKETYDHCMG